MSGNLVSEWTFCTCLFAMFSYGGALLLSGFIALKFMGGSICPTIFSWLTYVTMSSKM